MKKNSEDVTQLLGGGLNCAGSCEKRRIYPFYIIASGQKNLSGLLNLIGENARIGVLPFHSLGKIEKSHHFLVH